MTGRGFTLVELVMVTALIAVMAAIAMPRYGSSIAHMRAEMAARKLAADFTLARTQARAASASRRIEFDVANRRYELPDIAGMDGRNRYIVDFADDPYRATYTLVFDEASVESMLRFDGYGAPNLGATVTIRAGGAVRIVTLDRSTGAASISK